MKVAKVMLCDPSFFKTQSFSVENKGCLVSNRLMGFLMGVFVGTK